MEKQEFIEKAKNYSSQKEMAEDVGYSISWVKKELKIHGLKSKEVFKPKEKKIVNTRNTEGIYGSLRTNRKIYLDKFIELYNQGLNDSEIGKFLGVNNVTIHNWRVERKLPSNFVYTKNFDTNKFIELYNQGLNWTDIAKELNSSESAICSYGKELGLTPNKFSIEELSEEEFQILYGSLLGDSYLSSEGGNYAHSLAQAEYFYWKYNKLRRLCSKITFKENFDTRTNKYYACLFTKIRSYPAINNIWKLSYKNKIKYINTELLNKLTELGLAVWFMDDGYYDHGSVSICTNCFTDIDINNIISILRNNFNLHFSKHSNNIIRLTISDFQRFKTLIKPYIHPSLLYKIGEFKTPLNGEPPIKDNPVLNLQETEENA